MKEDKYKIVGALLIGYIITVAVLLIATWIDWVYIFCKGV